MELIKDNEKGKVYQSDKFQIFYRNKDSISGDNSENVEEEIYLVSGEAEITLREEVKIIKAPIKIEIPAKTYHKIKALTDIIFILYT